MKLQSTQNHIRLSLYIMQRTIIRLLLFETRETALEVHQSTYPIVINFSAEDMNAVQTFPFLFALIFFIVFKNSAYFLVLRNVQKRLLNSNFSLILETSFSERSRRSNFNLLSAKIEIRFDVLARLFYN